MKRGGEGPQMEAQSFTFHEADNYLREYTWPDEAWESITLDQTVVPSPIQRLTVSQLTMYPRLSFYALFRGTIDLLQNEKLTTASIRKFLLTS